MPEPLVRRAPLFVVGMNTEARIARRLGTVRVGTAGLDVALAGRPPVVVSFGLCGGLDPTLEVGALVIGTGVTGGGESLEADAGWIGLLDRSLESKLGLLAGTDEILSTPARKAEVRAQTLAVAVDMESLAVARAAKRAGVPFAILRAVSDSARDALPRSAAAGFRADGRTDVGAVIRSLAARPWEIPALVRTGANAGAAFRALERAAARLWEDLQGEHQGLQLRSP